MSDLIDRQAVLDILLWEEKPMEMIRKVKELSSVTPTERIGHWKQSHIPESILAECSECGFSCGAYSHNYCPNCGCRMVEPQESEDKE